MSHGLLPPLAVVASAVLVFTAIQRTGYWLKDDPALGEGRDAR